MGRGKDKLKSKSDKANPSSNKDNALRDIRDLILILHGFNNRLERVNHDLDARNAQLDRMAGEKIVWLIHLSFALACFAGCVVLLFKCSTDPRWIRYIL